MIYIHSTHDLCVIFLITELPSLVLSFITDSLNVTRGQRYEVTCVAETTEGLRNPPEILWGDLINTVTVGTQEDIRNTSTRTLVFDPFTEEHETEYNCTACINIDTCNGDPVIVDRCDSSVICLTTNSKWDHQE